MDDWYDDSPQYASPIEETIAMATQAGYELWDLRDQIEFHQWLKQESE